MAMGVCPDSHGRLHIMGYISYLLLSDVFWKDSSAIQLYRIHWAMQLYIDFNRAKSKYFYS